MPENQHLSGWVAVDEFIDQVNARLEKTGMTITTLSEESGVSRQHLYKILSGEHNLSMAAAQSIAEVLGLKIATVKA